MTKLMAGFSMPDVRATMDAIESDPYPETPLLIHCASQAEREFWLSHGAPDDRLVVSKPIPRAV